MALHLNFCACNIRNKRNDALFIRWLFNLVGRELCLQDYPFLWDVQFLQTDLSMFLKTELVNGAWIWSTLCGLRRHGCERLLKHWWPIGCGASLQGKALRSSWWILCTGFSRVNPSPPSAIKFNLVLFKTHCKLIIYWRSLASSSSKPSPIYVEMNDLERQVTCWKKPLIQLGHWCLEAKKTHGWIVLFLVFTQFWERLCQLL